MDEAKTNRISLRGILLIALFLFWVLLYRWHPGFVVYAFATLVYALIVVGIYWKKLDSGNTYWRALKVTLLGVSVLASSHSVGLGRVDDNDTRLALDWTSFVAIQLLAILAHMAPINKGMGPSLRDIFLQQYPQCKDNNMEVKEVGRQGMTSRTIAVTRTVSVSNEDVKMELNLRINRWGDEKEFEFLNLTDFIVVRLFNGTREQQMSGINNGTGNFTKFIHDVVADGSLYVYGATSYWRNKFLVVNEYGGIIKVKKKYALLEM